MSETLRPERSISDQQRTAISLAIARTEDLRHDLTSYRDALRYGTVSEIDVARKRAEERLRSLKQRVGTFEAFDDGSVAESEAELERAMKHGFRKYDFDIATASDEVKDAVDYRIWTEDGASPEDVAAPDAKAAEDVAHLPPNEVSRKLAMEVKMNASYMGAHAYALAHNDPVGTEAPKSLAAIEEIVKTVQDLLTRYRASAAIQRASFAAQTGAQIERRDLDAITAITRSPSWFEGLRTFMVPGGSGRPYFAYDPANGQSVGVTVGADEMTAVDIDDSGC